MTDHTESLSTVGLDHPKKGQDVREVNLELQQTYVYFFSEGSDGPIKIGLSYDVPRRLKHIVVSNPREIKFRLALECESLEMAAKLETKIHKLLWRYHLRGEWFENGCLSYAKIIMNEISDGAKIIKSLSYFDVVDVDVFPPHKSEDVRTHFFRRPYERVTGKQPIMHRDK